MATVKSPAAVYVEFVDAAERVSETQRNAIKVCGCGLEDLQTPIGQGRAFDEAGTESCWRADDRVVFNGARIADSWRPVGRGRSRPH